MKKDFKPCIRVLELTVVLVVTIITAWQFVECPLHEIGHLIYLKLIGTLDLPNIIVSVTPFGQNSSVIFSAEGGLLIARSEWAIFSIAGIVLPYIVWLILIASYKKAKNIFYSFMVFSYSLVMVGELIVFNFSQDLTLLIENSGTNPIIVGLSTIILCIPILYCLVKKLGPDFYSFVFLFLEDDSPFLVKLLPRWNPTPLVYNKNPH
ncbi:MAG: hypothetical protein WC520_03595 [Candidatus Paceibacterota bacterium]